MAIRPERSSTSRICTGCSGDDAHLPGDTNYLTMYEQTVSLDKPDPESTHATCERSSASSDPVSELAEPNNTETSVSEQQLPSHVEQLDATLTAFIDTTSQQPEPVTEHFPIQSQHAETTKTIAPEEEVVNIKDPGHSGLQAVTADTVYSDTDFARQYMPRLTLCYRWA